MKYEVCWSFYETLEKHLHISLRCNSGSRFNHININTCKTLRNVQYKSMFLSSMTCISVHNLMSVADTRIFRTTDVILIYINNFRFRFLVEPFQNFFLYYISYLSEHNGKKRVLYII